MTKSPLSALLILLLFSCSESKNEPPKTDYQIRMDKEKKLDTLNLHEAFQLTYKNKADLSWDTAKCRNFS